MPVCASDRRRTARNAQVFTLAVIACVLLLMAVAGIWAGSGSTSARDLLAVGPATLLALGGVGAFVETYRVRREDGEWRIWHAAGWALFIAMTMYAGIAATVLLSGTT